MRGFNFQEDFSWSAAPRIPLGAAAIIAGGSLLGGIAGGAGAKSAGNAQAGAAQEAARLQFAAFQQTQAQLAPFRDAGTAAIGQIGGLLGLPGYSVSGAGGLAAGDLVKPFNPTMEQLAATPGYQFTRQQGLNAVTNQFTSAGLGGGITPAGTVSPSGPEGQGLAGYAENLASTTFQQQFQNYWSQLGNIYNMLSGVSTTGANAAAGVGSAAQNFATNAGNALQAGAGAQAAGTSALFGGIGNAISGAANTIGGFQLNNALLQRAGLGTTGGTGFITNAPVSNVAAGASEAAIATSPGLGL